MLKVSATSFSKFFKEFIFNISREISQLFLLNRNKKNYFNKRVVAQLCSSVITDGEIAGSANTKKSI